MEIRPVKDVKTPKYPLRDEIGADALKTQIPKRWAGSTAAKVALGTLAAMTLAGCVPELPAGLPIPPSTITEGTVDTPTVTEYLPEGTTAPAMLKVAPMFLHGEGRGAFGCVMVAPPVFLSEVDALAVINETAKEYGLEFTAGGPKLNGVPQPVTNIYGEEAKPSNKTMSITPDFIDAKHDVIIEFVSVEDVKKWHEETGYISSVETYETQNAADQLSDGLEQAVISNGYYYAAGVLYDPCELYVPEEDSDKEDLQKPEEKTRQMSEEQLKKQAKDFFEWLKTQRII